MIDIVNRKPDLIIKSNEYANVPHDAVGIYCFYSNDNQPLYVGKSICLRQRLFEHMKGFSKNTKKYVGEFESVVIYIIEEHSSLDYIETIMINTLKPKYNIDKAYYNLDENYNIQKDMMEQTIKLLMKHDKELDNLRNQTKNLRFLSMFLIVLCLVLIVILVVK